MPTGLKITIVFNFIAVAILCSVASMAEPTKVAPDTDAQAASLNTAAAPNVLARHQLNTNVIANGISANVDPHIDQSANQNREATPAPWIIHADGSVQWLDTP